MNRIDMNGKRVIITGGAQGIGFAIAERLVKSGAVVAIWDLNAGEAERAAKRLSAECIAFGVDVADGTSVENATTQTIAVLSTVDGLVNSAGITGPVKLLVDYDQNEWNKVLAVNLTGTFNCCRAIVPLMAANNYGRIVNIASVAGKEGNPNLAAYSAAKAGVIGLTKSLGKELAKTGIAVNCITPTTAKTPILDGLTPEFIEYMRVRIPRDRFVELNEVASMVAWMLSEENSYTTAATFDLSGGRTTY
ncbi:SDR family NAD(P)-dependent oxidoreductase [Brucella sp. NBRC 12950]|uniref:SDR family NAD(P)-dependent oxidoreductase n=1 Tax=Brucella sp. NBRC 12950 TaxID=2994518 RepID=UPI0024A58867|nr:SDR family NAD(P)-dependent oxidoreductase [Brucella sp. NBRC 12950]GLU28273.1 3-oxoacyl-ACP reductase [Brucella sp. NBRC 12950]